MLPDYMEKQTDITGDMRAILVDWMVEVQVRGHSFLHSSPHAAFGMCALHVPAEAPASIPSAELILPLPALGMSLPSSLGAWPMATPGL